MKIAFGLTSVFPSQEKHVWKVESFNHFYSNIINTFSLDERAL